MVPRAVALRVRDDHRGSCVRPLGRAGDDPPDAQDTVRHVLVGWIFNTVVVAALVSILVILN